MAKTNKESERREALVARLRLVLGPLQDQVLDGSGRPQLAEPLAPERLAFRPEVALLSRLAYGRRAKYRAGFVDA